MVVQQVEYSRFMENFEYRQLVKWPWLEHTLVELLRRGDSLSFMEALENTFNSTFEYITHTHLQYLIGYANVQINIVAF